MIKIKIGHIIACRDKKSLISETICLITSSKYSHLAIVVSNDMAIEADGISGLVIYRNIEDYKNNSDIYTCELTDTQKINIVNYLKKEVGQKYDRLLLFVLFIKFMFKLKFKYKNNRSVICSELVNNSYKKVGIKLSKKKYPIPDDVVGSKLLIFSESY